MLSRCSTARGSSNRLFSVGPTKVNKLETVCVCVCVCVCLCLCVCVWMRVIIVLLYTSPLSLENFVTLIRPVERIKNYLFLVRIIFSLADVWTWISVSAGRRLMCYQLSHPCLLNFSIFFMTWFTWFFVSLLGHYYSLLNYPIDSKLEIISDSSV